jgi:predicted alpha-1,6-mannanase (GH76 family)
MKVNRIILSSAVALLALCGRPLPSSAADPLASIIERDFSGRADTLTTAFINQFMSPYGFFWAIPSSHPDHESQSDYLYWQQAHAMDVVIYSYERIRDTDATKASRYRSFMRGWYNSHAHNWYHDDSDPTGFLNEFTDDMCWISLTMLHMSEALQADQYADMARTLFDNYIEPRGWRDENGFWGLPWKSNDMGRNACTNSPGCLLACKLYERYGEQKYLDTAIEIYRYMEDQIVNHLGNTGRVEDPALTYTQGTFAEACRRLYHVTGDANKLSMAQKVTLFLATSSACNHNGLLRHEGTSLDQSIFKAVAIPYLVNMALDTDVDENYRRTFVRCMQRNANALWSNLNLSAYPATFCNYYWGEPFDETQVPSLGAMASGASLMEGMARLGLQLTAEDPTTVTSVRSNETISPSAVFTLDGRLVRQGAGAARSLPRGLYVVSHRKIAIR